MTIDGPDRGRFAEVDAHALAHDSFPIQDFSNTNGGIDVVKGDDDAKEGLQRRPGMDWRQLIDQIANGEQVIGPEDGQVQEVLPMTLVTTRDVNPGSTHRDEEGVRWGSWHGQDWYGREIERVWTTSSPGGRR